MDQELEYVAKIKEWVVVNGADFVVDLVVVILIIAIGHLVIKGTCRALREALQRTGKVSELLDNFILNVVSKVMWVVVIMVAVGRFGVDIGPLIAGLGVTGFIIGFAFQESLGNLAAGMMIALNHPFHVGDFVEVAGLTGVVKEMNMMATTLTTMDNKLIMVPNNTLWGSDIVNYTALDTRRVDMVMGISYGADISKAKEVLMGVCTANPQVLEDPAPVIEVTEMADSSVNLVVRPWCNTADYWGVFFAVNHAAKEALDAAGIEIPFPQMDVHHQGLPEPMPTKG